MTDISVTGGEQDPVSSGFQLAAARLHRYGVPFDLATVGDAVQRALAILQDDAAGESPGFAGIEMYVEMIVVGAAIRAVNDEPQLNDAGLQQALESLGFIINSLFHWRCRRFSVGE